MAEIALKGNMKVKTLKADFKKAFGASLRVYKSARLISRKHLEHLSAFTRALLARAHLLMTTLRWHPSAQKVKPVAN